ncbi:MAG TPA: FAD-dependent oxidoreductase [Nitrospiria bacterium]|nr:FAD-dependent oxidoreductase [Nitrospiria bacterium]
MKNQILILGAGLSGLSAAWHLKGKNYQLIEKESEVGGVCRSYKVGGFTFDYTGHLLHFRKPEIKSWVEGLLGEENLVSHNRRAFIYSQGGFTDYPFQANLHGLPKDVVKECLLGFIKAFYDGDAASPPGNFEEWIYRTLGDGIARHFMIPFNEKLWNRSLKQITAEWTGMLVPRPKLEEVINGALGLTNQGMGYNASFLYPREGGIMTLAKKIAEQLKPVRLGEEVWEIHTLKREVVLKNGKIVPYGQLVSSLPLDVFIGKCTDLPNELQESVKRLEYISVYAVNLGVNRPKVSDKHWIYFPEKEFPFYRLGLPSNLSPSMAPEGMSSLSVEVSALPEEAVDPVRLADKVKKGLHKSGILSPYDSIIAEDVRKIHHAYVIFNHDYLKTVPVLRHYLSQMGIHSIGRYGSWEHTSIEDALVQGKEIARHLTSSI